MIYLVYQKHFRILYDMMYTSPSGADNFLYFSLLDQISFCFHSFLDFQNFPDMMPRRAKNNIWGQKSDPRGDKFYHPLVSSINFLFLYRSELDKFSYPTPSHISCHAKKNLSIRLEKDRSTQITHIIPHHHPENFLHTMSKIQE